MASSDEEGEIMPDYVTNYHFVSSGNAPVPFSNLPLHWSDQESVNENGDSSAVFLIGTTDGGLQRIYKEVIAWKLELSFVMPGVYMLSKRKMWIKLEKPRRSYEDVVKTVWIVIHCIHFAKRNVEATGDQVLNHLTKTLRSYDVVEPIENYLSAHLPLIRSAVATDKDLAKSKYLQTFLMEIENPGRRETLHEENQTTNKSEFIVSDDDMENDDDSDEEAQGLFDSVCAFCDNGGDVLPCEGRCTRSFHPTIEAGAENHCESLGFGDATQYEAIPTFLCNNCKHQKHQCFACGLLGSSDKSSAAEVFRCVSATCGHFYHPKCVALLLYPYDKTLAKQLQSQIAAGESFTCPVHKCRLCKQGENKEVHDLQFAVCRRCPKAYHRKCLPRKIAFVGSADGTIKQRAWDKLLPKRILIYCMSHKIIPILGTPKRNHITFPCIVRKRNQEGNKIEKVITERRSKDFGSHKESDPENMPKVIKRRFNTVTDGDTPTDKGNFLTTYEKRSSLKDSLSISKNLERSSSMIQSKSAYRDMDRGQAFSSKPVKKITDIQPPSVDTDMKTRILKLMKDSTSSFNFEEFVKEEKRRCTDEIYSPQTGLDKTITFGKVEASVKAVRAALKNLEDGGSVEDAKTVCEPNVLNQLIRWKKKLRIFLAPFIYGPRYTSYGRHFTSADKLKMIVNRLHWYMDEGDMIVDFCCGSNDFSWLMKEKLESTGKKCLFKNYDKITAKNTFNFEKRNWFSVPVEDLPNGSSLIMGLNPPFGVQAALANKFIDHALKFKPKLLILIVPRETKRLDRKPFPYDLIWEEEQMLSGNSFYLPGSVDTQNRTLDDWNVVPPLLSLWSRPDWTAKHKTLAEKHNHINPNLNLNLNQNNPHQEPKRAVLNHLMFQTHDYHHDFNLSTILDDVQEEQPDSSQPDGSNPSTTEMTHTSPVISSTNSRSGPTSPNPNPSVPYGPTRADPDPDPDPNPLCTQPSHSGPYAGSGPPQYANSRVPYGLYGSGPGYTHMGPNANSSVPYGPYGSGPGYALVGSNTFPNNGYICHSGQSDFTCMQRPYANYGYATYPTQSLVTPPSPTFTSTKCHKRAEHLASWYDASRS